MIHAISIIIVDDHPMIRKGIKSSLEDYAINVIEEAATGEELLKKLPDQKYDVILLDLDLPDKNGLDIMEQLKTKEITIPVLIFSVYSEKDYALRAIKAGAKGFIHKQSDPEEIANAIKQVASGQTYMSATVKELARQEISYKGKKSEVPHHDLSDRELEVMLLLSKGMKNKDISNKLHISEKTVSTYRKRILDKMDFTNDAEMIKYVISNKLDPSG